MTMPSGRATKMEEAGWRALHSPTFDALPPETIVVHVLPYLTNAERSALARTCCRLFRLLRHERVYRLSAACTRKYLADVTFCEEVKTCIPAGNLVLQPFECAMRAFHFAPFEFKRARMLFEEALADENTTELEKARAYLSLHVLHAYLCGVPFDICERGCFESAFSKSASLILRDGDAGDPVCAFEMGYCHYHGCGTKLDYRKARSLARSLFVSSADGGCAQGAFLLAECLYVGDGSWPISLRPSPAEWASAARMWGRAAAMGHFGAMYEFGICLYYGKGVARDEARGIALMRSAAVDEGSLNAKQWLDKHKDELKRKGL